MQKKNLWSSNYLQKSLERERGITQVMTRDHVDLKNEIIQIRYNNIKYK